MNTEYKHQIKANNNEDQFVHNQRRIAPSASRNVSILCLCTGYQNQSPIDRLLFMLLFSWVHCTLWLKSITKCFVSSISGLVQQKSKSFPHNQSYQESCLMMCIDTVGGKIYYVGRLFPCSCRWSSIIILSHYALSRSSAIWSFETLVQPSSLWEVCLLSLGA